MQRVIIGCGRTLRGEDAFGVDVIKALQRIGLRQTELISVLQLTPELVLKLIDADEVIFIDAGYCDKHHYALACRLEALKTLNLTHHISPKMMISMLNNLYGNYPKVEIFSMLTNAFERIENLESYYKAVKESAIFILQQRTEV